MNRRRFLAGLTLTAAGLLIPERKIWALDRTMIPVRSDWLEQVNRTDTPRFFYSLHPTTAITFRNTRTGNTWTRNLQPGESILVPGPDIHELVSVGWEKYV